MYPNDDYFDIFPNIMLQLKHLKKEWYLKALIYAKKALKGKIVDKNGGLKRTYPKYLIIDETKTGKIKSVNALLKEAGYFWIVSNIALTA